MISKSLLLVEIPKIANRSRNMDNNDISTVRIMSFPLKHVFYKPKSLPQFGMLMQSNEVVALLGMRSYPEDVDGLFAPYTFPSMLRTSMCPMTLRPITPKLALSRFIS
jgi:hypothetical protein